MKFIDLFCGIGGFRIGMEKAGFECVFSSEIDEHAINMYEENFGDNPKNDITTIDEKSLPDFDVLCAGFPCQSFSISGKMKGFYDEVRGTLFFDIYRIIAEKKPKAFILENVKNLSTHDKGRTLSVILSSLEDLGYTISYKVLNARDFGVPQNRERTIIIGFNDGSIFDFNNLNKDTVESMRGFLDTNKEDFEFLHEEEYTILPKHLVKKQKISGLKFVGYRNKKMRTRGVRENTEHLSRVHKQPNRIYSTEGTHPTFSSQEPSGRYFIFDGEKVRKLTIAECYRFMGFPEDFIKVGSAADLYRRIGNSISPPMVEEIAVIIMKMLNGELRMNDKVKIQMEQIYSDAKATELADIIANFPLNDDQLLHVNNIVEFEATQKGVYTVLLSSLFYKVLNPSQDVRYHQKSMEGGYSGRTFDTRYTTPFLKEKRLRGAMKESGWLTRSLEQDHPYTLDFPGKISNKKVKNSFLSILDDVETYKINPINFIMHIMSRSIIEKEKQNVEILSPIKRNEDLNIEDIINLLKTHFYYKYNSRGASILPVIAFHSIYKCLIKEMKRFEGKKLDDLASHYSSDRSSGATGDIVIRNEDDSLFEVVEVKFEIPIDKIMIEDAYMKIKSSSISRYYILSTFDPSDDEKLEYTKRLNEISEEHGVQIIINGLIKTLSYYLRLINNTNEFIELYIQSIEKNPEINYEHKIAWNKISSTILP